MRRLRLLLVGEDGLFMPASPAGLSFILLFHLIAASCQTDSAGGVVGGRRHDALLRSPLAQAARD